MAAEWENECSKPLKLNSEDADRIRSSDDSNPHLQLNYNNTESSSSGRSSEKSDIIIPGFNLFAPPKDLKDFPRSTSSSSATSDEDLFQVLPAKLIKPQADVHSAGKVDDHSQASSKDRVFSDSSAKSNESEYGSSGPPSPSTASDITHESAAQTLSPTQSPPVQMMDRSGGFDPYRIPSSVFARSKASTPVEWSVASNDSLFSIHIGNNSFSRDHVIMWGEDVLKSGELPKSPEPTTFNPTPPRESLVMVPDDDVTADVEKIFKENQRSVGFVQEHDDGRIKEKTATNAAGAINSSRHSDESGTSIQSFSFPIGKKSECHKRTSWMRKIFLCGRKKSSCCCFYCSQAFGCCGKWPSCSCPNCGSCGKWPSCSCPSCSSCCKWPSCRRPSCSGCTFCYSWNCSKKRICCSRTLTEVDRSDPITKADTQKYRQQMQNPQQHVQNPARPPPLKSSSKRCCGSCRSSCCSHSSCCSWRSCFSWWSCCSWRSCCPCRSCSCDSCFSCRSCSCKSCFSCGSCSSRESCFSCRSCCSCKSCFSCRSCHSCGSCFSCWSCRSCFSCGSCRSCCSSGCCHSTVSCHPCHCCSRCC